MSEKIENTGTIKDIWRYAVKSMGGENIESAKVVEGGILGDRGYALIDQSNGKIVSAKMPNLWGNLLELGAKFTKEPQENEELPSVAIYWPDGTKISSNNRTLNKKLSDRLGREVEITKNRPSEISLQRLDPLEKEETILDIGDIMMEGRFSDYAALHIVTTSSLNKLHEIDPDRTYNALRFRPNIIIDTSVNKNGFIENSWVDNVLCIGEEVRLKISDPTPRCAIPTLAQKGGISKDPKILRTIVEHNSQPVPLLDDEVLPCVGVYAFVLQTGEIKNGDVIRIEKS